MEFDCNSNQFYYHNTATGEITWERPSKETKKSSI